MEGELIFVSVISTIGGLIGLYMMQYNWTLRQKIKYGYQMKRAKLAKKLKTPVKEEESNLSNISGLLPLLKNLDGDQISALADRFLDADIAEDSPMSGLSDSLIKFATDNPEMVANIIDSVGGKKKVAKEETHYL